MFFSFSIIQKETGKNEGEKKVDDGKKDAIVLKIDLHCEGCAKKVKRLIRNIDGNIWTLSRFTRGFPN